MTHVDVRPNTQPDSLPQAGRLKGHLDTWNKSLPLSHTKPGERGKERKREKEKERQRRAKGKEVRMSECGWWERKDSQGEDGWVVAVVVVVGTGG